MAAAIAVAALALAATQIAALAQALAAMTLAARRTAAEAPDGGGAGGESSNGAGAGGEPTGRSGAGGTGGFHGIGGFGGVAGGSGGPLNKLGRACIQAKDCADPKFPELTCVTAKDTVLGGGAPPKGLCTMPCTVPDEASSSDACEKLGAGALCFPFADGVGYCVEGCSFGQPALGEPEKCHGRPEFACNPGLLAATSAPCQASSDCESGDICSNGFCNTVVPACLPACAGDIDCDEGMYCDQSFLSGVCVTKKQTGKGLGEPCTVPAPNEPDEPDECLGYCAPDVSGTSQGHCIATCAYGAPCAWNVATQKYDGACILINSQIVGASPDTGVRRSAWIRRWAASSVSQALPDTFRGGGLCLQPANTSVPYDQCAAPAP